MAQASIPVDLFNPGQVFACLGLLEAADIFLGEARGSFIWSGHEETRFHLSVTGDVDPVATVLNGLASAQVVSYAPENSALSTAKWRVPTQTVASRGIYPMRLPTSPATLPIWLECQQAGNIIRLEVNHWGDSTRRDNVKFWAGSGGYPGAALFRDALDLVRDRLTDAAGDPFAVSMPQSSSFRFDWRRDYIPLDVGFSPNEHGNVIMVGYPVVEILAAIGLTHARPKRSERNKLEYRYSVLGLTSLEEFYDPLFLRAALGGATGNFPHRDFLMQLDWPGKENQARCITNVIEEKEG